MGSGPIGGSRSRRGQNSEFCDVLHLLSHDIRTPLNAMIGFSEMMQQELLGPLGNQHYQEYARHIRESSDLLLQAAEEALMVSALLSGRSSGRREAISLGVALSRVVTSSDLLERVDMAEVDVPVLAEPKSLEQALRFLVLAALEQSVDTSLLEIRALRDGPTVELGLSFACEREALDRLATSRAVSLAGVLLEFDAGGLEMSRPADGRAMIKISLEAPAQRDLFLCKR